MSTLRLESRVDAGPPTFSFRTRDGLLATDEFRPAELLALEGCWDRDPGDLLVAQANYGVVGTVLGARAARVTMTETSARAAECCRANASRNGVDATVELVTDPGSLEQRFDVAVYVPKPYTPIVVGCQHLLGALDRLRPGGDLFLGGSRESGLARYREWLSGVADGVESVESSGGVELVRGTRPVTLDATDPIERRVREATVGGTDLRLVTAPGLFSAGGLDDGTRLLLDAVELADGERVLDLCCGYGPVGAYAGLTADCDLALTDDNVRATGCAEQTLAENGVSGRVVTADCLDGVSDDRFDRVICNPPTHAGSGVLRELFGGAAEVLAPGGEVTFVHHRNLDLLGYLDAFGSVRRTARSDEHVVRTVTA